MQTTTKHSINGINIEVSVSEIEMPWGSVYCLFEARMERPILPHIFRLIGELSWAALEPTFDAACEKMDEYLMQDLAGVRA